MITVVVALVKQITKCETINKDFEVGGCKCVLIYLWPLEGLKQIKANRLILFTYELIRYNLNHNM